LREGGAIMDLKRGQRIFVDWPHTNGQPPSRAYGRVLTAADLGARSTDKDELWVKWSRGKGHVHLALLEADVRLNGTTITPVVRTYTRPYVGKLKAEYMTPEGASKVNTILLERGMPSLCMRSEGVTPNIRVFPHSEWHVFRCVKPPTEEDFPFFAFVIGPFKTSRAAYYMAEYGAHTGNPHCVSVGQAERLSAALEQKRAEKCL
jgi:hypothetical protein